jgi:hypothetical protein
MTDFQTQLNELNTNINNLRTHVESGGIVYTLNTNANTNTSYDLTQSETDIANLSRDITALTDLTSSNSQIGNVLTAIRERIAQYDATMGELGLLKDGLEEELGMGDEQAFFRKRMIQNNTYYEKKYKALSYMMKVLIVGMIIYIALTYLNNKYLIPDSLHTIMVPILIACLVMYLLYLYVDILRRNTMNFDEYDFPSQREKKEKN